MTRLIAIGSGKGGVGKTWFAVSLSHVLARLGYRTLLVDGDIGLANVDVQLGLSGGADLGGALAGKTSIASLIQTTAISRLHVLAGQSGTGAASPLDKRRAGRMLEALRRLKGYDLLVVDLPSGVEPGMRQLMLAADHPIIMTTGEPTALTDAYALLKILRRQDRGFSPAILVNLAETTEAGRRVMTGFARVCDRFLSMQPLALGIIRSDRRVVEAISRQTSLLDCYPNAVAAADVRAVADLLVGGRPGR